MRHPDLRKETADLLRRAGTPGPGPEPLGQMVRLAVAGVTGCSGASATLWRDGIPAMFAASHPDLEELATAERGSGGGPEAAALASARPVYSADLVEEDRWPGYGIAALTLGVRCCVTLVHQSGPVAVTLSLFGARPGQPSPGDPPLTRLLSAFGNAIPGPDAASGPAVPPGRPEIPPPEATGR